MLVNNIYPCIVVLSLWRVYTADHRQEAQELEVLRGENKDKGRKQGSECLLSLYSCVLLMNLCYACELLGNAVFGRVIFKTYISVIFV